MANFIMGIISLTIGAVVLSGVFINTVKGVNTANISDGCYVINASGSEVPAACSLSTAEIALWGLLTIVGIAGLVYGMLNVFGIA